MTIPSTIYNWYRQGLASIANGATAVTGTTTAWSTNVKAGDGISFDGGGKWYEVASVTDNTHLTLATAFAETTVSSGTYAIDRRSLAWQVGSEAAARVLALQQMLQQTLKTTGQPPDTIGSDGAVAFDSAAQVFYVNTGGVWDSGTSFRGSPGTNGTNGTNGVNGELTRYGSVTVGNVVVWQSNTQVKAVPNVSLNGSGWLGLGTDNPVAPVHIKGVAPGFFLEDTAFADNDAFFVYYAYNLSLQRRTSAGVYQGQPVTFDFRAPDNALVLSSAGNLGLGVPGPAAKIHAETDGAASTQEVARLLNPSSGAGSGVKITLGPYAPAYSSTIECAGDPGSSYGSYLWLRPMLAGGSLGSGVLIGTNDAIRFGAYGAGTLTTDASGNITASSDEDLKDDIQPFTRGLQEILQINPISYLWSAASGFDRMNRYAGFSAQNVETAIPEAVGVDANGYLTLTEKPILAALVNAVKALSEQNAALAARIAALEQGA